jgi:hypothetical protein
VAVTEIRIPALAPAEAPEGSVFGNPLLNRRFRPQRDLSEASIMRVWSVVQFTSQVLPPSPE